MRTSLTSLVLLLFTLVDASGTPLPPAATGDVYLSSYGTDEVHCYDRLGSHLFEFTHADLDQPRGLAFSPERELYVASQKNHKVLVFEPNGNYLRQFSDGELQGPTSVAFGPDGKLYVSSFGNDKVIVFAEEVYDGEFTGTGLNGPNCIAFAPTGDIYVASQLSNQVYRFDSSGVPFAPSSFDGGGLWSPMGIALNPSGAGGDPELYVTGGASHSIVVFNLEGEYLRKIQGSSQDPVINGPQGIAFDESGNFSVSSFYEGSMALYSSDGTLLHVFADSGVRTARSIAFFPFRPGEPFLRGDFNEDGNLDLSDAVATLGELFLGVHASYCDDAADSNDDGILDLSDPVYTLTYLFTGGPPPLPPHPEAGSDPTEDDLDCWE